MISCLGLYNRLGEEDRAHLASSSTICCQGGAVAKEDLEQHHLLRPRAQEGAGSANGERRGAPLPVFDLTRAEVSGCALQPLPLSSCAGKGAEEHSRRGRSRARARPGAKAGARPRRRGGHRLLEVLRRRDAVVCNGFEEMADENAPGR